jgi:hypothetical protein
MPSRRCRQPVRQASLPASTPSSSRPASSGGGSITASSMIYRKASTLAARTASSTPASSPGRCFETVCPRPWAGSWSGMGSTSLTWCQHSAGSSGGQKRRAAGPVARSDRVAGCLAPSVQGVLSRDTAPAVSRISAPRAESWGHASPRVILLWLPCSSVGASGDALASRGPSGPLERPRLHSHAEHGNERRPLAAQSHSLVMYSRLRDTLSYRSAYRERGFR